MNNDANASSSRPGLDLSSHTACADLRFKTALNSPVPEVLDLLRKGDVLSVRLQQKTGVVLALKGSKIAGSITSVHIARLIECLGSGVSYEALVLKVHGARCDVEVSAA